MAWHRLSTLFFVLGWWFTNLWWISRDRLLRDGDEEGHVGAMELFKDHWVEQGIGHWFWEIWAGNYGEYPPLFAGLMGAWWGGVTQICGSVAPESVLVRGVLLIWPFLTALAVSRMAHRLGFNWKVALIVTLSIPLQVGLGRHFMPENMMVAFSTLAICASVEWYNKPTLRMASLIGAFMGLGLLTKQTMILVSPMVVAVVWLNKGTHRHHAILSIVVTSIIFGPWIFDQLSAQSLYLLSSSESKIESSLWTRLVYPPITLFYGLGILVLPMGLAVRKIDKRQIPLWLWIWTGTLIVFMILPKQYPRLLLGWLPVTGLWIAHLWNNPSHTPKSIAIGLLAIYIHTMHPIQQQVQEFYTQTMFSSVDDGCPQVWMRPPSSNDGHLSQISAQLEKSVEPQTVVIKGSPNIPCSIQTTHPWRSHLEPYLRRRNLDATFMDVTDIQDPVWQDADIQIEWKGDTIDAPMILHVVE